METRQVPHQVGARRMRRRNVDEASSSSMAGI